MDHLPGPRSTADAIRPLEIQFLCTEQPRFHRGTFTIYPFQRQWASIDEPWTWLDCSPDELACRAQEWLYFGLLYELYGNSARAQLFYQEAGTSKIVSSNHLKRLFGRKRVDLIAVPLERRSSSNARQENVSRLLRHAFQFSEALDLRVDALFRTGDITSEHILANVSLSIKILLCSIAMEEHAQIPIIRVTRDPWVDFDETVRWRVSPSVTLREKMKQYWCPIEMQILEQRLSCSAMYYMSRLDRSRRRFFDHTACHGETCSAFILDNATYETQDTASCPQPSQCPVRKFSTDLVVEIIEDDQKLVPLISCSTIDGPELDLKLVYATKDTPYVAISHVWADGLGNPHENAIKDCQMRRIVSLIKKINARNTFKSTWQADEPVMFWLDTLCIPVDQTDRHHQARKKAINSISKVFSGAEFTLVLDSELQCIKFRDITLEEALAHAMVSSWMTRCWTLQEASLSLTCYFQFEDVAVNLYKMVKRKWLTTTTSHLITGMHHDQVVAFCLFRELSAFLFEIDQVGWSRSYRNEMWNIRGWETVQTQSFVRTWNVFCGRATSVPEDSHRIFARMQDFRFAETNMISKEDRIKAVLKGHRALPIDILFTDSPKLRDPSPLNRWAPDYPFSTRLDWSVGDIEVFTDRLEIFAGTAAERIRAIEFSHTSSIASRFVLRSTSSESGSQDISYWVETMSRWTSSDSNMADADMSYCLLFPNGYLTDLRASNSKRRGCLCQILTQEGGEIELKYIAPVLVWTFNAFQAQKDGDLVFPPISYTEISQTKKLFVRCDMAEWPTTRRFYSSLEGPLFAQAAGHVLMASIVLITLTWPISFIYVMIRAPYYHLSRNALTGCYIAKCVALFIELAWWRTVWADIERKVWCEDFGQTDSTKHKLDFYKLLNDSPSLYIGYRRFTFIALVTLVTLCIGFLTENQTWARWMGIMLGAELVIRTCALTTWLYLPRTRFGKFLASMIQKWWPIFLQSLHAYAPGWFYRQDERVPYRDRETHVYNFRGIPLHQPRR